MQNSILSDIIEFCPNNQIPLTICHMMPDDIARHLNEFNFDLTQLDFDEVLARLLKEAADSVCVRQNVFVTGQN